MPNADLYTVASNTTRSRAVLGAVVLSAALFALIAARLQFGDLIAELTVPSDPQAAEMAQIARSLAPSDPLAIWLAATIEKNSFSAEKTDSAVEKFEETVRLSPRDFRWWIELGRAYEQADRPADAESAMLRSVALAPAYTFPHWQLGNFYLRQGREDEAFAELKKATAGSQTYREQVFSLAWEYFGQDSGKLEQVVADTPDAHAGLAIFYAQRGRAADSLRVWNLLTDEQKRDHDQIFNTLAQGLYDRRYYPQALELARQLGTDLDAKPEAVTNAGFERPIGGPDETKFGWIVVRNDSRVDIAADQSIHHEGSRGLRFAFKNYTKPELANLYQTIVVEPGRTYRISFWIRTESLKSSGLPQLQIVNALDDKLITLTAPYPAGTNDWQQVGVEFTTPSNCNAVYVRTVRAFCGENCPLTGTFWYDDFELKRTN